jgi:hypothetical protein
MLNELISTILLIHYYIFKYNCYSIIKEQISQDVNNLTF